MSERAIAARHTRRQRTYGLLEAYESTASKVTAWVIIIWICLSVLGLFLESHENIKAAYGTTLNTFERVTAIAFTIELLLRFWAAADNPDFVEEGPARGRIAYLKSFGWIDFFAVLPFYLELIFPVSITSLLFLRALRLLRLLKLIRYFRTLEIFKDVLRSQISNLIAITLIIAILLVVSASLMYAVEHNRVSEPEDFSSITRTLYWSVVTLTSVGYGDAVPITNLGKLIGGFMMLLGVGLVALPAALLGGKFADEIQARRERLVQKAKEKLEDGELDAEERRELMEEGQDDGFTEEEVTAFTESARVYLREAIALRGNGARIRNDDGHRCPKCGHVTGKVE